MDRAGGPLCFAAAVLTLVGLFLPLFVGSFRFPQFGGDGGTQRFTLTSWGTRYEVNDVVQITDGGDDAEPIYGVPLLFAVAVLFAAAMLGVLAAAMPSRARLSRLRLLCTTVGAAFLAAAVWTIGMQVFSLNSNFARAFTGEGGGPEISVEASIGVGFWSMVAGAALAIAATVFIWLRPAREDGLEPHRQEPETPRLGIPVVAHRLPDEPPDQPRA